MSDHEFEKQVQARMGGLKLSPSEVLWPQVEKGIRRARRRRRIILWVPIMLLLIGGAAGYFVFLDKQSTGNNHLTVQKNNHPSKNSTNTENNSTQTPSGSTTADNKNTADNKKVNGPGATQIPDSTIRDVSPTADDKEPANKKKDMEELKNKLAAKETGEKQAAISNTKQPKPNYGVLSHKRINDLDYAEDPSSNDRVIAPKKNKKTGNKGKQDNLNPDNAAAQITRQAKAIGQEKDSTRQETLTIDSQADSIALAMAKQHDPVTAKEPATKRTADKTSEQVTAKLPPAPPKKNRIPSKWQFGVQGNVGGSHISRSGLFDLFSKKNTVVEDLAANQMANALPSYQGIPPAPKSPSGVKTGKSFSIGGFIQKPLSKRLAISTGLQYTYFSVETKVGTQEYDPRLVNNALTGSQVVSNYYRGNSATVLAYWGGNEMQDYTNRYHFIELPVTLHTQLNKGKVLPVIWDAGIAVSYLYRTNALHYDGTNDVYYKDQDFFNPVQFSINSALNVELFSKKRHPVVVGPRVNYQLSNLLKKEVSSGQHLWSFGLNMKMFLKK